MQHIFVNLKRFDVPPEFGGVNRFSTIESYGCDVVKQTLPCVNRHTGTEFVYFLPEAHLNCAVKAAKGSMLGIGAQAVYREDIREGANFGAYTSNRPAAAVKAIGCTSVIIGHCEERKDKGEILAFGGCQDGGAVDRLLNEEVKCAVNQGLRVLYCIGEKTDEVDTWQNVLSSQLTVGLKDIDVSKVVIAYEPVWSIGPGKTPADTPYITKVAKFVKEIVGDIDVVYGGGLKESNAEMLASIPEISGGLIALTRFTGDIGFYPEEFTRIVDLYLNAKEKETT